MNARRAWVAASLMALLSCNEDQPVQVTLAPPLVTGIQLLLPGGPASSAGPTSSLGGTGGQVGFITQGPLLLGSAVITPEPPDAPTSNQTGTLLDNASFQAHTDVVVPVGNILVEGSVTTDVAGLPGTPRRIQADAGDIIVIGYLQSGQSVGVLPSGQVVRAMADLELDAPNGTIYIFGEIHTGSVDGILDGDSAGALTLNARQIVILGIIDTSGQPNQVGPQGGNGGTITMNVPATGQGILQRFGALFSGGATGLVAGGKGGDVNLTCAGGPVNLFGSITSSGGYVAAGATLSNGMVTPAYPSVIGGNGGAITVVSAGPVSINMVVTDQGGSASTTLDGAIGGNGGSFTLQNASAAVPVQLFGTIDLTGGSALAATSNAAVMAGAGGSVQFGSNASPLLSILSGSSFLNTSGGSGDTGGPAGPASMFIAGAVGGDFTFSGTLACVGGPGGTNPGGAGAAVSIVSQTPGSLSLSGQFQTDGGGSVSGPGGNAGSFLLETTSVTGSNAVALSALITSDAGSAGTAGGAGAAGQITFNIASGTLVLIGGLECIGGDAVVEASPTGPGGPSAGGQISLLTGASGTGSITLSGLVIVTGGTALGTSLDAVAGGASGTILISTLAPSGAVLFTPGGACMATGGNSSGSGTGGAGGTVTVSTATAPINITGSINTSGGSAGGAGTGGPGGRIVLLSDATNSGAPIGAVTLQPGGVLIASGGAGGVGGSALSDHVPGSVTSPIAVTLSAEAVPGKANAGAVSNQGLIVASGGPNGGSGGDVLFQGTGIGSNPFFPNQGNAGFGLPVSGAMDLDGSGYGAPGDFAGRD